MGYDPKVLPQRIIDMIDGSQRKELKVKTSEEIAEKVDVENERELQRQCANMLRLRSIWFSQSRMDRPTTNRVGTPDFLFAIGGVPIAVECKTDTGKLSDDQEDTMLHMTRNGWRCVVIRSVQKMKMLLDSYL